MINPLQNETDVMEATEGLALALGADQSVKAVAQLAQSKEVSEFNVVLCKRKVLH